MSTIVSVAFTINFISDLSIENVCLDNVLETRYVPNEIHGVVSRILYLYYIAGICFGQLACSVDVYLSLSLHCIIFYHAHQ